MGDLTFCRMQQCKQLSRSIYQVGKYLVTGMGSERIYPICTCSAYKYGKRTVNFGGGYYPEFCKHILQIIKERCNWHEQSGVVQTDEERKEMICPECRGETEWIMVGV